MLKTQEKKLVEFLSKIDKKHIDELIDILTDFGSGRIALNSTVKAVLLHEKELSLCNFYSKEFIELIITEFQLYAGNSVINHFRKDLVSYKNILDDVFSTVFITSKINNSMKSKEEDILIKLLGESFINVEFETRLRKSQSVYEITKGNLKNGLFNGIMFKAISSVAGIINSFSSEAYRIMLPFIVQISWLKMKYGFYESTYLIDTNKKHNLIIAHEQNKKIDKQSISTLNQLLNIAPSLIVKQELSNQNYAIINIPLDRLTNAKDGDGLRAIVHGDKGIIENARIYEADKLKNLVNSGVLMNLASTLVAQKHLADINEKLNQINENLQDIKDWLQDERKAKIESAYKEACNVYKYLKPGEKLSSIDENILGSHLKDIQQALAHIQSDIRKSYSKIKEHKEFQPKKIEFFKNYLLAYEQLKLCCNAILAIYAIFFLSSQDKKHLKKMSDIELDMKNFLADAESKLKQELHKKLEESRSIFNLNSTELANMAFVYNREFDFKRDLAYSMDKLHKFANTFLEDNSMDIYVSLENGKIKEAQFIDS